MLQNFRLVVIVVQTKGENVVIVKKMKNCPAADDKLNRVTNLIISGASKMNTKPEYICPERIVNGSRNNT